MSIKAIVSDFSRVLLFPVEAHYTDSLNKLHRKLSASNADYSFLDYFRLNEELLEIYKKNSTDRNLYIFTSDEIQNHPAVRGRIDSVFDEVVSAKHEGISKTDPEAYTYLCHRLGLRPKEILYVDDQQKNLNAAKQAGLQTIRYLDNKTLETELVTILYSDR